MWGVGICEVWRRLARALSDVGVPLYLTLDNYYGEAHPAAFSEVAHLANNQLTPSVWVGGFPTSGDSSQAAQIRAFAAQVVPVALTTMLERDRIGPQSAAAANQVAQWWLPCDANIEAFKRSGVDGSKIHKVRVPFFPSDPHLSLVGRMKEQGPTHFYRIGVLDTRKDQAKTLLAFLRAFRPGEAILTFKTTHMAHSLDGLWIDDFAVRANGWTPEKISQAVKVICEVWTESELLDLHRRGDVYLSLSHGEGWDMPAFDAMLSGNRMIYTESGGPQEFASDGDLLVPTAAMVPCDPVYKWEVDARWIDYSVEVASEKMREAHEKPLPKMHRRSWAGFTSTDVGSLMKSLLLELRYGIGRRPRAVPQRASKNSLAIVSLFRQCQSTLHRYKTQIETLQWPTEIHVVCVEGDSSDNTPEILDAWEKDNPNIHVIHHSLGNPLFGSTLNPTRLNTLATVSNIGLDYIVQNLAVEYVFFLTADLICYPDLALRLKQILDQRPDAGVAAPFVWDHRGEIFYDTWAFRRNAAAIDEAFNGPKENADRLGLSPLRLESVGSVLFCRAAPIYAGVRFTPEQDVVGFSSKMLEAGYTIWADPSTYVRHPQQVFCEEIREQSSVPNAAAVLARRWTNSESHELVRNLCETFTLREIQEAAQLGPLESADILNTSRFDLLHVYQPNQVPHGVASHLMFLREAYPTSSWVTTIAHAAQVIERAPVKSILMQLQWGCSPSPERLTKREIAALNAFRKRGIRVVINYHHAEASAEWLENLTVYRDNADQIVFHHPKAVEIAGTGTYFPLPIPSLKIASRPKVGGLVTMGFPDPSRCVDQLVGVAERLSTPLYGYGPKISEAHRWYDTRSWTQFRQMRSYMNEHVLASEVARHSVALFARSSSSRAYSSASARFCIACNIPVVVDFSKSYEDLHEHVTVVDYATGAAEYSISRLLKESVERTHALELQNAYAQKFSMGKLLIHMGLKEELDSNANNNSM